MFKVITRKDVKMTIKTGSHTLKRFNTLRNNRVEDGRKVSTTMTLTIRDAQNQTLSLFLLYLKTQNNGHLLTELLIPYMKNNYGWFNIDTWDMKSSFEVNGHYRISTLNGYTLPREITIAIKYLKRQKNGIFIGFNFKNKEIKKKVEFTLFGNQVVRFGKYHAISGSRKRKLLFTCDDLAGSV
jgi:hypothetical protein